MCSTLLEVSGWTGGKRQSSDVLVCVAKALDRPFFEKFQLFWDGIVDCAFAHHVAWTDRNTDELLVFEIQRFARKNDSRIDR